MSACKLEAGTGSTFLTCELAQVLLGFRAARNGRGSTAPSPRGQKGRHKSFRIFGAQNTDRYLDPALTDFQLRTSQGAVYNDEPLTQADNNHPGQSSATLSASGLRGLLLPCPTPFDPAAELDLPSLLSNIARWNATGICGYAMLGSTGERVHLSEVEYVRTIEATRAAVTSEENKRAFLVGVGQQSTRGTINEVTVAAAGGAGAVLVLTPHFYRPAITQDALLVHYTAVADASPVPVILYSMPALTGIKIEPETVARLSEHPNIIAIKDSSADIEGLERTVELVRDDFLVLTGNGTVLYEALRAGAQGAILAVGCVAPQLCLEIFRAVKAGEEEHAAALQRRLTPLAQAVTTKYGIGGLKAALDLIGYVGGTVRAPLRSPNEAAREEIARLLAEAQAALAGSRLEAAQA